MQTKGITGLDGEAEVKIEEKQNRFPTVPQWKNDPKVSDFGFFFICVSCFKRVCGGLML